MAAKPNPSVPPLLKKKREDFHFGKILGEGSYSNVILVKEYSSQREYAMKILNKQHIIRQKKVPYVTREKEVLKLTHHPFIIQLHFTFQDKENLYYGLSYAQRGELLKYINKLGSFNEECTRFYSAEIILALKYLHDKDIIHRDLKPENILLSDDWHIKLADFGTAKILSQSDEKNQKSNSFVGTAQYVSPELLTDKVCYKSSDLWALGCIIYQLLSGRPPFRAANEYLIFQQIIKPEYTFPDGFLDIPKDLVIKLLVLDPKKRLGCEDLGGYSELENHQFFQEINFEDLPNTTPPKLKWYVPSNDPDQPDVSEDIDLATLSDKDDDLDEWILHRFNSDNSDKIYAVDMSSSDSLEAKLKKQEKESEWHSFVDGHLILKNGILDKRKGLFAKRRMFLLTEGPELYYVDPQAMVLMGKIPWTKELKPEAKNFKIFFVHTPKRTYYLEDPESRAIEWVKKIEEVHKRYFPNS